MITVGIVKNWDEMWIPDDEFLAQSRDPGGRWDDIQFQFGSPEDADYLVVLNRPRKTLMVNLPKEKIWGIIQEPPNEIYAPMHKGQRSFGRVYNQLHGKKPRYHLSHPMIPWFVRRTWQQLSEAGIPEKQGLISCISSKTVFFRGHVQRLRFIERIQQELPIELFGRGFKSIEDKWDAHAPFKYSIVMENHINPYYWTEKIADCLLSWTMPIYAGCTRIGEYLPQGSFLPINMKDPDVISQIRAFIEAGSYEKHLDSIAEARQKILNDHSFFAFLAKEIRQDCLSKSGGAGKQAHNTVVRSHPYAVWRSWINVVIRKVQLKLKVTGG
jgi:hypothetical protein